MKSAETSHALEVRNLTKCFRHGATVVDAVSNVSLTLDRGDFVAVMGPSGSGKSTLLHMIAGLTRPDHGSVRIDGADLFAMSERQRTLFRRTHLGLVFQAFNLIPSLTGRENITLPLLLAAGQRPAHDVDQLILKLGLSGVGDRRPDAMSGGEQQRVAIGRALVTSPSLILADEPTGALDSVNGRKLCESFRTLCAESGATVLMVTHNPAVAFNAARVVVLHDGRLVHHCATTDYASLQDFTCHCIEQTEETPA